MTSERSESPLEVLQKTLPYPLPEDAEVLFFQEERGIDPLVLCKLRVARDQWETCRAQWPVDDEAFSNDNRYLLFENEGDWDPQDPATLPTAQLQLDGGFVVNLGVDQSAPDVTVLYLVRHGT